MENVTKNVWVNPNIENIDGNQAEFPKEMYSTFFFSFKIWK